MELLDAVMEQLQLTCNNITISRESEKINDGSGKLSKTEWFKIIEKDSGDEWMKVQGKEAAKKVVQKWEKKFAGYRFSIRKA